MLIRHHQRGFSLIELMIGLTLVAMLLTFGMPSFTVWLQNTRIRSAAEALQSGLQLARAEAVRRNTSTVFTLTNSAPITANVNSVTPSSTGNNWFLRVFQSGGAYSSADFV
ncbi:MAG TPA: GspH/FimT family pseudopilin, partial [Burkholderiales bacterium]